MQLSKNGEDLIKHFESLRLETYKCSSGKLTIGWGHTASCVEGQKITRKKAEELFQQDVRNVEKQVDSLLTVTVSQNLYDALVSFVFNCGVGNFKQSTILKKVNSRAPMEELTVQFRRWVFGKGKRVPGLVRRREAEILLASGVAWKTNITITDTDERSEVIDNTGTGVEAEWLRHEESAHNPSKNTTVVGSSVAAVLAIGNEAVSNPAIVASSLKESAEELSPYLEYAPIVSYGITTLMVMSLLFVIYNRVKKIVESKF